MDPRFTHVHTYVCVSVHSCIKSMTYYIGGVHGDRRVHGERRGVYVGRDVVCTWGGAWCGHISFMSLVKLS